MKTRVLIGLILSSVTLLKAEPEMIHVLTRNINDAHVVKWSVSSDQLARLKTWDPSKQELPFNSLRLVNAAKAYLKNRIPQSDKIMLFGVRIWALADGSFRDTKLNAFCELQFAEMGGDIPKIDWKLAVVFLSDGTIVEPTEYLNGEIITGINKTGPPVDDAVSNSVSAGAEQ